MNWSFSDSLIFKKCQLMWYFKNWAHSRAKNDPVRREAFILSQLQTIDGWRGQIVDKVIENYIVNCLNDSSKQNPSCSDSILYARDLFERQLDFATKHKVREEGMVKSKVGDSFAAFYKIEYGDPIDNIELDRAWNDIQSALKNLYCNTQIRNLMKESYFLKSQKAIQFRYHDENIKGIPDLICFARNKPPTIIDWKVHAEGIKGHFLQLAIYAIAMDECRNESSWREHLQNWSVEQFKLIECQLLTDENREYCLDESELSEAYDYIATSLLESKLAREGASGGKMQIDNFTTTQNPQTCVKCNFKKICWN